MNPGFATADNPWLWLGFTAFILGMLALDLGVFHRKSHHVGFREAIFWSIFWTLLALAFNAWIAIHGGTEMGQEFFAGYLLERALSFDNIFVIVLVFAAFAVPDAFQHRVLFWGILGALVMRALFIGLGATLVAEAGWILYLFGAFLVYTGFRMAFAPEQEVRVEDNRIVKLANRFLPLTPHYHGDRFWVREEGRFLFTPLFVVLLVVEATDLIFAVDSIPAIFGVTQNSFLIYSSNIFAILGLRAMYFLVADLSQTFHLLKYGLAMILVVVGVKMCLPLLLFIPGLAAALPGLAGFVGHLHDVRGSGWVLGLILLILVGSVVLSLLRPKAPAGES